MRLIDADLLMDKIYKKHGFDPKYEDGDSNVTSDEQLLEWISRIPTVDAVDVVRCKTCKHNILGECAVTNMIHQDESFCSWGSGE